ncbi:MAG TPA: calcium/sodium antiporter [Propionibacteriaceae bacterium]|jgi:cation:H+ antiporter|nr:calcium/sodium antiporter [Propionibacteriaceae bacterium]
MITDVAWFLTGLILLIVGAELVIRGGTRLGGRLGIRPIVIGLTVVSIGTSMPELAIGVVAAAEGTASLAVGNIAGTNVVNLLLILGLSALIRPLSMQMRTLRLDLPMMSGAALLLWALAFRGTLTRLDGLILLLCAIAYTAVLVHTSRLESQQVAAEFSAEYADENADTPRRSAALPVVGHLSLLVGGIAIIVVGAEWLVNGAVGIARAFEVSDALIGLTIVAIGTSAPELVTTVVSTVRGERDIALGNLLGSGVYNIALVLGITCLAAPQAVQLEPALVRIDIPIMVVATLVCVPIFISGRRVARAEGGAMVAAYLAYLAFLLTTQT